MVKRRQVSEREERAARDEALTHREQLLADLQAREAARREAPTEPTVTPEPQEPQEPGEPGEPGEPAGAEDSGGPGAIG